MTGLDKEGHPKVLAIEPADMPCGLVNYREEGVKCGRLGLFDQALKDLDIAFHIDEECWRSVVLRARGSLLAGRYQKALDEAEKALDMDYEDIDAQLVQARALFNIGEFEKALMIGYRGWKRRKFPPEFAQLIFAAEETIEDCIGRNVGPIMLVFLDLIYEMEEEREEQELLESQRKDDPCIFPDDDEGNDSALGNKEQQYCRARLEGYMCCKYLGQLCYDRRFCDRINNPTDMAGPNKKTIDKVLEKVKQAIDILQERQEMLRERLPLYSVRFREAIKSVEVRKRRRKMLMTMREVVRQTALALLEKLRMARIEKDYKTFYHTLERCYEFLMKQSRHVMPQKRDFQDALYTMAGIGFLDMKTLRREDPEEKRKLMAQMTIGVPTPNGQAIDGVLTGIMQPCRDMKKRLEVDEGRLKGSDSHLERAWLYCDMGKECVELRRFDMVRFYCRKCIAEAKAVEHWSWCINSILFIAKSEMKQNNRVEALHALNEAVEYAQKLKNEDVLDLLHMCMEVIKEAPTEEIVEPRKEREKKIIDMMVGADLYDQAKVLLQCIAERERIRLAGQRARHKTTGGVKKPKKKEEKKPKSEDKKEAKSSRVRISTN